MSCSNDWDTLREVVVGRADHKPVHLHDEPATRKKLDVAFSKSNDTRVKQEKKTWRQELLSKQVESIKDGDARHAKCMTQVDNFVQILKDNQVNVLRPEIVPGWADGAKTPWWSSDKQYGSPCPRDLFIKFGDLLVETYSGWRCRYFEGESYYQILEDHCARTDTRYVKMPRGILSDSLYCSGSGDKTAFTDHCGVIEAADIRRFNKQVFMQTGGYSNDKGFKWMEKILRSEGLKLNKMTFEGGVTSYYHLDAKLTAVDDSNVLFSPDDKPSQEIFDIFQNELGGVNLVEAPRREVMVSPEDWTCSGLNLNFLCLGPKRIICDQGEKSTVKFLREEMGCDVITMDFSYAFEFGGAFNCWTLDLIRN